MIISASRRTDIPTYYSPWLLNRLRTGEVLVRNPFNRRQVSRLRLDPGLIDCLVLWTKNPAPLLPYLPLITELGYSLVVHFTITGCDHALEPGVPALDERIATFCALARILGPQRVLWRFDPIVLTQSQGPEDWLNRFSWLAAQLHGYTLQCAISFVSLYAKCRRNLAGVDLLLVDEAAKQALVLGLAEQARLHGMRLVACCDAFLIERCGVEQARCIDAAQLSAILGYHAPRVEKDPGQRSGCGCSRSVDIGAYECCGHGCRLLRHHQHEDSGA